MEPIHTMQALQYDYSKLTLHLVRVLGWNPELPPSPHDPFACCTAFSALPRPGSLSPQSIGEVPSICLLYHLTFHLPSTTPYAWHASKVDHPCRSPLDTKRAPLSLSLVLIDFDTSHQLQSISRALLQNVRGCCKGVR